MRYVDENWWDPARLFMGPFIVCSLYSKISIAGGRTLCIYCSNDTNKSFPLIFGLGVVLEGQK